MKKRKLIIVVSIVVILGFSIAGMAFLSNFKKDPPQRPAQIIKQYVKADKVVYRDIKSGVTASGRLNSGQHIDLSTEVQGKILAGSVPLKKGQNFKKGDLLLRIYDKEVRLALLARKSRFLNAIANILPDIKVDFAADYGNWTAFFESIDMNKDLPPLPAVKSGKEKIFLASRNILSDYYSIKGDEVRLKKYVIHAPFDGTFIEVYLEVGSVANPGSRVGHIIRTDHMELEVPVEVGNLKWIQIGDRVKVSTEDGARVWWGKVIRKSRFVDADTQASSVFVDLKSTAENPLYKGLYLRATFPGIVLPNTMEIPRNAVFNGNQVFVVKEGRLAKEEIEVHKIDRKKLIFSGLQQGTHLVVEPLVNAKEETPVEIIAQ